MDIKQRIADFEHRLRKKLVEEVELAALAERHREITEEFKLARRLLPVVDTESGSGGVGVPSGG